MCRSRICPRPEGVTRPLDYVQPQEPPKAALCCMLLRVCAIGSMAPWRVQREPLQSRIMLADGKQREDGPICVGGGRCSNLTTPSGSI